MTISVRSNSFVLNNNTDKWRKRFGKVVIASTIALTTFAIFFIVASSNSYHHIHAFSGLKTFSIISCGISASSLLGSFVGFLLFKNEKEKAAKIEVDY